MSPEEVRRYFTAPSAARQTVQARDLDGSSAVKLHLADALEAICAESIRCDSAIMVRLPQYIALLSSLPPTSRGKPSLGCRLSLPIAGIRHPLVAFRYHYVHSVCFAKFGGLQL